jgi:predicted Kef-type K+ transport protein
MRAPLDIEFALKGIIGTVSPVLGVVTSFQEQIEWHLRIASLVVGLAVGALSLVAMIRKLRRRKLRDSE